MKNYRKKYEKELQIKIPKNYDIHHIDFDRKNNEISNLVMLPKKLHIKYHGIANEMLNFGNIQTKLLSVIDNGNNINQYNLNLLCQFYDIWSKCSKYVDYRNYLLGIIPNIHNIQIGNEKNER